MKLRAGELREQIELWAKSSTVDSTVGGLSTAPTFVAGPIPAKLGSLGGFQRTEASAANAIGRKTFWIRYRAGVAPSMLIKHDGRLLTIVHVEELEPREVLAIHCEVRNVVPA